MARYWKLIIFSFVLLLLYVTISAFLILIDGRDKAKMENLKYKSKYEESQMKGDNVIPNDRLDRIFWFLQVSDIHLSKYSDRGRKKDLMDFCIRSVPLIAPDFVIASGDLTDAKTQNQQDSEQYMEEWQAYQFVIEQSGVLKHTLWYDIRGNHDSFNVPHLQHKDNMYRVFSVQGRNHMQSYHFKRAKQFGNYAFIGLDANPNPGLKRPYNFFGVLSTKSVKSLLHFAHESAGSNMTIWFGHHPTSTIVSPSVNLQQMIGRTAVAYLCGHLHTWNGLVPQMHTLQPAGYLELELGDWRDGRNFRVMAIDHDMFSFVDVQLNQWPIILITNPKDAQYIMPNKEMSHRIGLSTHIRILVWSLSPIREVSVYIDNQFMGLAKAVQANKPLYVLPWNPKQFSNQSYNKITVKVQDITGHSRVKTQLFSSTGTPVWQFPYFASLLLLGDQSTNVRAIYYTLWVSMLAVLVGMRLMRYKVSGMRAYLDQSGFIALYRFANHDPLFYSMLIYLLYSSVGPLMVGPIVQGYWGFVFIYGIKVADTFIPEAFPYVSEFIQNITFIIPLCIYLVRRIELNDILPHQHGQRYLFSFRRYGFFILLGWQICFTVYSTTMPYGMITTLCSPCRLWLLPLAVYMLNSLTHCPRFPGTGSTEASNRGAATTPASGLHMDASYANLLAQDEEKEEQMEKSSVVSRNDSTSQRSRSYANNHDSKQQPS